MNQRLDLPQFKLDPFSTAVLLDPYPYYETLRECGDVVWLPQYGVCASGRIDVVEPVFRDWRTFCSARGVGLTDFARKRPWRPPSIILEVDPPAHERTRRVMARALSPQAVKALEPRFESAAERLVDGVLARQTVDGVTDLAEAFPLEVFADAVGIGPDDRSNLLRYGSMVFNALGPDNAIRREALAGAAEIVAWIATACARSALTDDGFGAAIYAAADAGEIDLEEASLLVRSLLSAGIDTTVATLANLLFCFADNPLEWSKLRAQPTLTPAAIDEVLRFTSPVHTFCRTTALDARVADVSLPAGTKVLCVMGAANRDPARWEEPERFDITRSPRPHIAFGSGIHVCVGQHVARQEVAVLLAALVARVHSIEVAGTPQWRPGNAVHTLARLPLSLTPA